MECPVCDDKEVIMEEKIGVVCDDKHDEMYDVVCGYECPECGLILNHNGEEIDQ